MVPKSLPHQILANSLQRRIAHFRFFSLLTQQNLLSHIIHFTSTGILVVVFLQQNLFFLFNHSTVTIIHITVFKVKRVVKIQQIIFLTTCFHFNNGGTGRI